MSLTSSQLTKLNTDATLGITNNTTVLPSGTQTLLDGTVVTFQFAGTAINALPHTPDAAVDVAHWYNMQASPNFFGNYSQVLCSDIFNAITWKKMTPADAVPTTPDLSVQVWNARQQACLGLQLNLQILLSGRASVDATKGKVVSAFQDALSTVPSAANGATQDAGWAAVQKILCRKGTYAEKLFADTSGGAGDTNTTAATFTFEGNVNDSDIRTIWVI